MAINIRLALLSLLAGLCGPTWHGNTCPATEPGHDKYGLQKIAFGSCANQNNPCPIWQSIADYRPDVLLLLGDNIYADLVDGRLKPATPDRIAAAYGQLAALPSFTTLRSSLPILATWDDHDFGNNDAGVEWEHKDAAQRLFHDFFNVPPDAPARQRRGVYDAKIFGPVGKRVQIIMLDTRYFRSRLQLADEALPGFRARPYIPREGEAATMLGDAQWEWLEEQLRQPAEIRIIASSIQVLSHEHPFEKWGNFPTERARLFQLIRQCQASGVIVVSGDRHLGEISLDPYCIGYPLYDITASGLNQATQHWRPTEPNGLRLAGLPYGNHFGSIEIDWTQSDPLVSLQLRHEDGEIAVQSRVSLRVLQAVPASLPLPPGVVDALTACTADVDAAIEVQLRVASGKVLGDRERILLNSEVDFRSPQNFTVVVMASALTGGLAEGKLDSFLDKTLRAKGRVTLYNGARQLVVESAEQLEIIE